MVGLIQEVNFPPANNLNTTYKMLSRASFQNTVTVLFHARKKKFSLFTQHIDNSWRFFSYKTQTSASSRD